MLGFLGYRKEPPQAEDLENPTSRSTSLNKVDTWGYRIFKLDDLARVSVFLPEADRPLKITGSGRFNAR
jgi:hypothetical protein